MSIKKGTKVMLSSKSIYYGGDDDAQLPVGTIGVVRKHDGTDDHPYAVHWGSKYNNYNYEDLIIVNFKNYLKKL